MTLTQHPPPPLYNLPGGLERRRTPSSQPAPVSPFSPSHHPGTPWSPTSPSRVRGGGCGATGKDSDDLLSTPSPFDFFQSFLWRLRGAWTASKAADREVGWGQRNIVFHFPPWCFLSARRPLPARWVRISLLPLLRLSSCRGRRTFHQAACGPGHLCPPWGGCRAVRLMLRLGRSCSQGRWELCKGTVHVSLCPGDPGDPQRRWGFSLSRVSALKHEYLQNLLQEDPAPGRTVPMPACDGGGGGRRMAGPWS